MMAIIFFTLRNFKQQNWLRQSNETLVASSSIQ